MPKAVPRSWEFATESLVRKLKREGCYTDRTIRFYKEQAILVGQKLAEVTKSPILPSKVTRDHINRLLAYMREEKLAVSTQKNYIVALKRLCEHYDNFIFNKVKIRWPEDTRPTVDWLTTEQARTILDAQLTPLQEVLITLELCAGLRRVEVLRLTLSDIHSTFIEVRGKGHIGGKLRSVPIQTRVRKALDRWMDERRFIIESGTPPEYESDALLIYRHGRYIYPYSDVKCTGIDRHLKMVCESTGVEFSNHTLRRTFARQLWLSGAPLVTISKILGHQNTEQTLRYIGANADDMANAIALLNF